MIVAEGFVGDPPVPRLYLLQWGRNLIVAEGKHVHAKPLAMHGFNGAAT